MLPHAYRVTTAAADEPLGLTETKQHLRIEHDQEDDYISLLVKSARATVENHTGLALVSRTLETRFDCFAFQMFLPRPPLQSVTSVKYIDSAGTEQTVSTDVYDVDTTSTPGRVFLKYSQSWPTPRAEPHAVRIVHVAGYSDDPADVDPQLRQALLLLVSHYYEHREPVVVGSAISEMPLSVRSLLDPYIVWSGF